MVSIQYFLIYFQHWDVFCPQMGLREVFSESMCVQELLQGGQLILDDRWLLIITAIICILKKTENNKQLLECKIVILFWQLTFFFFWVGVCAARGMAWHYWTVYFQLSWQSCKDKHFRHRSLCTAASNYRPRPTMEVTTKRSRGILVLGLFEADRVTCEEKKNVQHL